MAEFIGGTLIFGSFAVFFVSLFALFKPLKTIKLGSRKRAAAGIGLSLVMIVAGGLLIPKPTPEQQAARDAAEAQRLAADKSNAEALEKASSAASAAEGVRAKEQLTVAMQGVWTEVKNQLSACDQAGEYVAEVAGRSNPNPYDIFPMVQQAEQLCRTAAYNVSQIRVPDTIPREYHRPLDKAFDTCRDAYYLKSSAYSSMGKVLNGDVRPSAVTEARSASESAQGSGTMCAVSVLKVATDAGITVQEFMGDDMPE